MKKRILYLSIIMLIAAPAMAQIPLVSYITTNGPAKYPTHIDSLGYGGFRVVKDTVERNAITMQRRKYGMAVYVQSSDSLYILRDVTLGNTSWFAFAPAVPTDLSGYLRLNDTTSMLSPYLLNAFGLKYGDTTAMLSGYEKTGQTLKLSDTAGLLSALLKVADTAAMLTNYAKAGQILSLSDTANIFAGYARNGQVLKLSDSSSMLSGYEKTGQTLKLSDTASILSTLLKVADTTAMLTNYVKAGQTVSISDSANMLAGYARNGQVLKLSDSTSMLGGYEKKGQTLKLSDTASILSTLLKVADTTGMLTGYAKDGQFLRLADVAGTISGLVRYTDTTAMLANYVKAGQTLRISDTSAMLANSLHIADTTSMLSGYTRNGQVLQIRDTASMLANYSKDDHVVKYSDTAAMFSGFAKNGIEADTFKTNITVYSTFGLGKYTQGQIIPAVGKTAMAVLIDALTQTINPTYVQPVAGVTGVPSPGTVEIGSALNITLTAVFTQNDAGAKTAESFSKAGVPLGGNTDNIASLTAPVSYTSTISYGQGAVKNNNLGAADPTGQINAGSKTSAAITYTPQSKRYWGYASTATPTDGEIIAALGGSSELSSSKAKASFDITISSGSHFIFFAYPASLGPLSTLSVGGFGSLASFTQTIRSFTNAKGYAQSYIIYVNPNDFSTTVSNIITN